MNSLTTRLPSRRRLIFLLVGTAAFLLALDAAGFGPIVRVRTGALDAGRPVANVLAVISRPISASWNGVVHYDDIEQENHMLRRRVAELEGHAFDQIAADKELQKILAATDIDYVGDIKSVTTRVVTDRSTSSSRIIEIDKGSDHGLRSRLPVVTGAGLIGQLDVVSGTRSTVKLLTSEDLAVGIRSSSGLALTAGRANGQPDRGLATTTNSNGRDPVDNQVAGPNANPDIITPGSLPSGLGAPNVNAIDIDSLLRNRVRLTVELSPDLQIKYDEGDLGDVELFMTSGLNGSDFPPGIPVGYLADNQTEPAVYATANLTDVDYLTVLVSEDQE